MFSVVLSWSEASGALKRGGGVGWGGGGGCGWDSCGVLDGFAQSERVYLVHKNAQISLCPHFHFSIMLNPTNPVNITSIYFIPYKLITEEGYIYKIYY